MISFASAYRGDPKKLLPQKLRTITERIPPHSLVLEDQASKWALEMLRRVRLQNIVSIHMLGTVRGWSCARTHIWDFGRPDVVHAYGEWSAARIALRIKRRYTVPFVWNVHSHRGYSLSRRWGPIEKRFAEVLRHCSRFLPVSEPLGRHWETVFGPELTANWIAIPNPVDESVFHCNGEARTEHADLVIFQLSKLGSPIKGVSNLLGAFAIGFKGSGAQLRLAGASRFKRRTKTLLEELSITAQVKLLGLISRDEVASEMRACDIYVQSSLIETFANPVAEALMSGRPVVTTASGGPELVSDSNGVVVPRSDPVMLAEGLRQIANNLDRYDPNEIRRDAVARFGHAAVFRAMEGVYEEALREKPKC